MPSFAASPWSRIAIRLDSRITLSRLYPKRDPPPKSVAQLPGSMYPTATRYPGPANARALPHQLHLFDLKSRGRNRLTVRIVARVAQGARHALDQVVGYGVLHALRLGVHAVPVVAELLRQIGLEDAMPADHPQRRAAPLRGELHAAIWHVLDQSSLREPLHHAAHRRRDHVEHRRDLDGSGEPPLAGDVVDDLEVVFDRSGERSLVGERVHALVSGRNGVRSSHGPTICG